MSRKACMIGPIVILFGILSLFSAISAGATDRLFGSYDEWGQGSGAVAPPAAVDSLGLFEAEDIDAMAAPIPAGFGIYEDWSSPTIRSSRWIVATDRAHEARREVLGHHLLMRYRLEGSTTAGDAGLRGASMRILASNPGVIDRIDAHFQVDSYAVTGCEANPLTTRVRPVAISLSKFNDGSSTGPADMTGDHFVRVIVNREAFTTDPEGMLTVQAFLFRCIDSVCSNAISSIFNLDMGKVLVGEPFSLRARWNAATNRFLVRLNDNPPVVLEYPSNLNAGPAAVPFADVRMQSVNANCTAGPTVTDAQIKVREILTNVSAVIP